MEVADVRAISNAGRGRPLSCRKKNAMAGNKAVSNVKTGSASLTASLHKSSVTCLMPSAKILRQHRSSPDRDEIGEFCA